MLGGLGFPELLIILVIVVILFGVNKLPRIGKGLGEGIRNFKDSIRPADKPGDGPSGDSETGSVDPK
jgi:sec-independent protein translocase protein TatA